MKWSLNPFEIAWRLAIVLLPWQTRWFHEGPTLGGYHWEGGRESFYLSWLPLIATIVFGAQRGERYARHSVYRALFLIVPLASILVSTYRPATTQWWIEVILLVIFVLTLVRRVDRNALTRWIIYAITPHALLGLIQYGMQIVVGSKWLGIAPQNPLTPGVSVIAREGVRWLRAYGGFPHPNIFGGWLVIGIVSAWYQARSRITYPIAALFVGSLVFSFSRSAWLAAIFVGGLALYQLFRTHDKHIRHQHLRMMFSVLCGLAVAVAFSLPLIQTRTASNTPLEARSLSEREQGFQNGLELFKRHPWIGTGPRTIGRALGEEGVISPSTIPIPPHNVFLLMLAETGMMGMLFVCLAINWLARRVPEQKTSILLAALCFSPILLLDHYTWSTWSGLVLVALLCVITLSKAVPNTSDEGKNSPILIP